MNIAEEIFKIVDRDCRMALSNSGKKKVIAVIQQAVKSSFIAGANWERDIPNGTDIATYFKQIDLEFPANKN